MKNLSIISRTFIFLAVIFILINTSVFARNPFSIKLIEKPSVLRVGQTHTFVFEVQNTSDSPLTLSSQCAASATLSWTNKDGSGGGTGSGCGSVAMVTETTIDPITGKFHCVTKTLLYTVDDFFTLQPKEAKRFEVEVNVPSEINTKTATVSLNYESKYDGSEAGLRAWKGEASSRLKMRVIK